jgi:pyruvate/2-oxoglutarate dehydrogenase complex dihydrolipoamide acyltransferase (E2) component
MFYQFSQTGNDAEVTIGVESGKAIDVLAVDGPDGRRVASVRSADKLGLAEIELESAEPSVEEVQRATTRKASTDFRAGLLTVRGSRAG